MRDFTIGLLSAAAITTTILLVRQNRDAAPMNTHRPMRAGESTPADLTLERIREASL